MTDQELRALIRAAVERHLGAAPAGAVQAGPPVQARPVAAGHISHAMYVTLVSGGDACFIEPAVPCNHCGYCQSHGH